MPNNVEPASATDSAAASRGAWQPLLGGAARERALQAVRDIADDLRAGFPAAAGVDASLGGGRAGVAVFFAYLERSGHGPGTAAAAHYLEEAMDAVASEPMNTMLYAGFPGVAWAATHLRDALFEPGTDDPAADVDELLREHLDRSPWTGDHDLIRGLVGLGVYALERLPHPAAEDCLKRIVGHLAAAGRRGPQGVTWWTDPRWLPGDYGALHPKGFYDLGVAHGVPGVIALLGAAYAAGIAADTARPLLADALAWLLDQQQVIDGELTFPYWVKEDWIPKTRLAWCYGDPGVAAALLGAARRVGEPALEREALAIAHRAAARPPERSGVVDAGVCHGAAGLGHVFNRLAQATGDGRLAETARSWFEQALAMRRPGQGVGGYQAWGPPPGAETTWWDDPSLLTGAAGIGLALLAAATDVEPSWDRVLLTELPTGPCGGGGRP
jgi:lantibiotic modifying enzyme